MWSLNRFHLIWIYHNNYGEGLFKYMLVSNIMPIFEMNCTIKEYQNYTIIYREEEYYS